MTREEFLEFVAEKYSCTPDYPWDKDQDSAVFRHRISKKWFALLMCIPADKIGKESKNATWVVNVKADRWNISDLIMEEGIYPAYHMNKSHWVTVALQEVGIHVIDKLLEESYRLTRTKKDI